MTDEYKSLNPKCKIAIYIAYATLCAILILGLFCMGYFLKDLMGDYFDLYRIISIIVSVIVLIYVIVAPQIFFRHYKYILTSDKIDVLRGVLIIRRTVVPIERVHQVEVTRGPINNLLKLANVTVTTAGGIAKIQFLDLPVAENIAEELNKFINTIVRDSREDE